jgi:hypothetical protein
MGRAVDDLAGGLWGCQKHPGHQAKEQTEPHQQEPNFVPPHRSFSRLLCFSFFKLRVNDVDQLAVKVGVDAHALCYHAYIRRQPTITLYDLPEIGEKLASSTSG